MSAGMAASAAAASAALAVIGVGRIAGEVRAAPPGARTKRRGLLSTRPSGHRLGARLARGGIPVGPDLFVALVAAASTAAALLAYLVLRLPIAAPVAAGLVVLGALALVRSADARHLARVEEQLPGIAQQIAAALAAGLSLRQALTRAARDAPEPARAEFARAVAELELGTRLEAALEGLAERVPAHDLRIMVTAILVQRRTGGNLARALAALSGRLEERAQLARELRGATAQARMTAWLVAALPLGGAMMTEIAAPGTLGQTLGQGIGPMLLTVSAGLYALGVLGIRRIGRVES